MVLSHLPAVRRIRHALLAGSAALMLAGLATAPMAQDAAAPAAEAAPAVTPETVVATVGGETITEQDLSFAVEDMAQDLQQVPPADRKAFLLSVLIDMKVMAQAARAQQMDQSEVFKRRLNYLEERALRRAYFSDVIAKEVTPEAVKAAYDAYVADYSEVHVQHILLNTEEDAKAIKAELDAGAAFETLAKDKSIDPSAKQNNGDLGFIAKGQTVQPFEDAAYTLEVGQVSDPVQSQFGWHIIKLVEKRAGTPPTFEQMGPQLQQQMLLEKFNENVKTLKSGIAIEIPDAALAAAVNSQEDQVAQ